MNLFTETIAELTAHGLTPADVQWVGYTSPSKGHPVPGWMTWAEWVTVADFEYDAGFKPQQLVDAGLVIVGADWWLERYAYDNAENWVLKRFPVRPDLHYGVPRLPNSDSLADPPWSG